MRTALEGIRVLDWSIWGLGPVASVLLGQLGADVIKLENREGGDTSRSMKRVPWGVNCQLSNGSSIHYEMSNVNKRSLALDLKAQEGKEIVYRLVERSDVFLQNFRYGVAKRLKLSYEDLRKYNPKLIYASASGLGTKGPDVSRPAFNEVGLARSGLMFTINGEDGEPQSLGAGLADLAAAQTLAFGVLAALIARERLGVGQYVDTCHLASCIVLNQLPLMVNSFSGGSRFPSRDRLSVKNPLWNTYKCKDGTWLVFCHLQSDPHWPNFCRALGIEHLENSPKFNGMLAREKNNRELIKIIDETLANRTYNEWEERFKECDLIYTKINRISDVFEDPQVTANEYIVDYEHPELGRLKQIGCPIQLSETPGVAVRMRAPKLGEHTDEILRDIGGYSSEEIAGLRAKKVIL